MWDSIGGDSDGSRGLTAGLGLGSTVTVQSRGKKWSSHLPFNTATTTTDEIFHSKSEWLHITLKLMLACSPEWFAPTSASGHYRKNLSCRPGAMSWESGVLPYSAV